MQTHDLLYALHLIDTAADLEHGPEFGGCVCAITATEDYVISHDVLDALVEAGWLELLPAQHEDAAPMRVTYAGKRELKRWRRKTREVGRVRFLRSTK